LREQGRKWLVRRRHHPRAKSIAARTCESRLTGEQHQAVDYRGVRRGNPIRSVRATRYPSKASPLSSLPTTRSEQPFEDPSAFIGTDLRAHLPWERFPSKPSILFRVLKCVNLRLSELMGSTGSKAVAQDRTRGSASEFKLEVWPQRPKIGSLSMQLSKRFESYAALI